MKKLIQNFRKFLVIMVLFTGSQLYAQSSAWSLLTHTSGVADEYMYECAAGPLGNVYYVGGSAEGFSVGGVPVNTYPNMGTTGFVGHVSASGNHDWVIAIGGKTVFFAIAGGLTSDSFGNSFFTVICFGGVVGDTLQIGPAYHKLLTRTEGTTLVVKMDSLGNVLWANEINAGVIAPGMVSNVKMISDSNGDLYLAGFFFGTQVFDTITILPSGLDGNFVAKCSANGNFLWAKSFGCKGNDGQAFTINRNAQNELFVSGGWQGDTLFVDGQYVVNPAPGGFFNNDRYLAKFSPSGALQWLRREGSLDSDEPAALAVMNNGDIICGAILGANPLTVNNTQTITGGPSWLITKYNTQGDFLSAQKIPFPLTGIIDLSSDGDDLYIAVNFDAPQITYGGVTLNNAGGSLGTTDIALFKVDTMYNVKWGISLGNTESEVLSSLSYSVAHGILLAGGTASTELVVGGDTINNMGLLTNEAMVLAVDLTSVGISTVKLGMQVNYFPNPASEVMFVNFEKDVTANIEIKVINTSAKLMLKESFQASKQIPINISSLPKGVYILELKVGTEYSIKKFIKE